MAELGEVDLNFVKTVISTKEGLSEFDCIPINQPSEHSLANVWSLQNLS